MANEKISQFAIDPDIEDIDGLAAMTITSGTSTPITYGNVALPGYAFTLQNILKTKTDRSDPDPNNWGNIVSNAIATDNTSNDDNGIMWLNNNADPIVHQHVTGNTLRFENKFSLGQSRHSISFNGNSSFSITQSGNNSTLWMTNTRTGGGDGVKLISGIDTGTGCNLIINSRGTGANLDIFSGKDINITSGRGHDPFTGLPVQQAGDIIVTLNTTTPTANQVLASSDANGTLEWQDKTPDNNTEYVFDTNETATGGNIKLELKESDVTGPTVGSILFEHGAGILLNDNVQDGVDGSFSIDLDLANATGVGVLPISSGGTGSATAPMVGIITAADKAAARQVLNVDVAGTDNSTNVTLNTTSYDYLSIAGQVITLGSISMSDDVTGELAIVNGGTGADTAAEARTNLEVDIAGTDNSTNVNLTGTPDYITISGQTITRGLIDLTTDVTGQLPVSNGGNISKTFQELLTTGGDASEWDIKDGYNAKIDFDASSANAFDFTDASSDITAVNGHYGTLIVINGSTAGTITFPTGSRWVGGGTPTPTDSGVDIYSFVYDGSNFYWTYGLDNKV